MNLCARTAAFPQLQPLERLALLLRVGPGSPPVAFD